MSFAVDISLCRHCGCCASGCVCGLIRLPESGVPYIEPSRQDSCVHCGHCIAAPQRGHDCRLSRGGHPAGWHECGTAGGDGGPPVRRCGRPLAQSAAGHQEFQAGSPGQGPAPQCPGRGGLCADGPQCPGSGLHHPARASPGRGPVAGYGGTHGSARPVCRAYAERGNDTLFRGAPCLILIHAPERILSETDCATAAAYLELILPSLGLGSCWAGMLLEACAHGSPAGLDLPEGHKLYAALMVGTPAVSYRRIPFRSAPVCLWK